MMNPLIYTLVIALAVMTAMVPALSNVMVIQVTGMGGLAVALITGLLPLTLPIILTALLLKGYHDEEKNDVA